MGLTIHYSLQSTARSRTEARTLIERLRQRAMDLPFKDVGPLVQLEGGNCDFHRAYSYDPNRWLLVQARQHFEKKGHFYSVSPRWLFAFSTNPGEGCEQANFGLAGYPATVLTQHGRRVRTGMHGWSWNSFCKTQYASSPGCGGVENFLRCHLSVVKLLDCARELGIVQEVSDEGGFWEKRDVKALVQEVGEWNSMIAGFVGTMKDMLGGDVEAAITRFANYEHIEADGRAGESGS